MDHSLRQDLLHHFPHHWRRDHRWSHFKLTARVTSSVTSRHIPFCSAYCCANYNPAHSVPAAVKLLLQEFPSILCTADVVPKPSHGVEQNIHTCEHLPVFAKDCRLDPEKIEIAQAEFKRLESPIPFAHSPQKRWVLVALWWLLLP